jgi:hypothetical protein
MALPPGAVGLRGHQRAVNRIVPLPDGRRIATASDDKKVRVFDAASGELLHTLAGHEQAVIGLAALGGDIIASGDRDGGLRVWDARVGSGGPELSGHVWVNAIAALDAGRFAVGAGKDLVFFTHANGVDVAEVGRITDAHAKRVKDISACGGRVVTASWDEKATVWDALALARLADLRDHTGCVSGVAMNERFIVTCSWDGTVLVHDAETFECIRVLDDLHTGWGHSVALVGGDHVLSTFDDMTLCVTSVTAGAPVSRLELPFAALSAAATQDGRLAVAGLPGSAHEMTGNAVLLPAPAGADTLMLRHVAAIHSGPALRALLAIETGSHPAIMRRALAGRRGPTPAVNAGDQAVADGRAPAVRRDNLAQSLPSPEDGGPGRAGEEEPTCAICMNAPHEAALVPCGHANFCRPCAHWLLRSQAEPCCAICRVRIARVRPISGELRTFR